MIIWGYNTTTLGVVELPVKCKSCGSGSINILHTLRYFTLFWIPVFPYRKYKDFFCSMCDASIENDSFENGANKHIIEGVPSTLKVPIWTFTGLVLIVLMLIYGSYAESVERDLVDEFIKNPQENSTIIFRTNEYKDAPYTFARVVNINEDGIVLQYSKYAYSKKYKASSESKNEANFDESMYIIATEELADFNIIEVKIPVKEVSSTSEQ